MKIVSNFDSTFAVGDNGNKLTKNVRINSQRNNQRDINILSTIDHIVDVPTMRITPFEIENQGFESLIDEFITRLEIGILLNLAGNRKFEIGRQ